MFICLTLFNTVNKLCRVECCKNVSPVQSVLKGLERKKRI